MHPKNPFAPTVHFNYRYFETDAPEGMYIHFLFSKFDSLLLSQHPNLLKLTPLEGETYTKNEMLYDHFHIMLDNLLVA